MGVPPMCFKRDMGETPMLLLEHRQAISECRLDGAERHMLGGVVVMRVEWVAAGDYVVARRGRAVGEGPADLLRVHAVPAQHVGGHVPVTEHEPAEADEISPVLAHD